MLSSLERSSERVVLEEVAIRMVIRDMGNGVDRVEALEVIPFHVGVAEKDLQGREPLPLPHPPELMDMCEQAAIAMGVAEEAKECVPDGFVRAIDERTMEFVVWCCRP